MVDSLEDKVRGKDELYELMKDLPTVHTAVDRLIEAAKAKGGYHNIGVVVVELKKADSLYGYRKGHS
jgi:serine/threonine protein phosphatase PrpC